MAEKKAEALELRLQGKTWQEVADEMGYKSKSAVRELVNRTIRAHYGPKIDDYVAITLDRMEALLAMAWDKSADKVEWHEQSRKVIADMRKMLGLDKAAPDVHVAAEVKVTAESLEAKLAAVDERAKREK